MIDNIPTAPDLLARLGQEGFTPGMFARIFLHFQDLQKGWLDLSPGADGQLAEIAIKWPSYNLYDYTQPEPPRLMERIRHIENPNNAGIYLGLITNMLPLLVILAGRNQDVPLWKDILEASEQIAYRERRQQEELSPIRTIQLFRELLPQ